jgi:hypothetical protein
MNEFRYGFGKEVEMTFDDAVERIIDALQTEGFGVLSDIDVAPLHRSCCVKEWAVHSRFSGRKCEVDLTSAMRIDVRYPRYEILLVHVGDDIRALSECGRRC